MRLIDVLAKLIVFAALWFLISLCWVGAEVVFEGYVHSSKVDAFIAGLLAQSALREIVLFDRRITGRKDGEK